jgi:alpha-N-arabinofuranosidase
MFTPHHEATLLPTDLTCADYALGSDKIPSVNVSASKDKSGKIAVTLCNLNPNAAADVTCDLQGAKVSKISGRVLTAETIQAHNTFDKPEEVKPASFADFTASEGGFSVKLPAKSVVVLAVDQLIGHFAKDCRSVPA